MGFETVETSADKLRSRWREEFPVTRQLIYLNHAAVAPLSRRAAGAMKDLADDALNYGSLHYDKWLDAYEGFRVATAKLIGAHRDEIALVKNTSEGIATVAMGLSWRAGDAVVIFQEEFPANLYPWQKLADKGVEVRTLSLYDSLDRIDEACRGARLLAVSFVNYLSGYRANLKALSEICRRRGCFFFVDAIQGLGVIPLDVEELRIDALSADGHKWLLGPEGCGLLYVRRERQDEVEPVEFGWTNVAGYTDYASRDLALRQDAGRYEPGTLNTIGCFGLQAAIELLLEIGIADVEQSVLALTDRLAAGAKTRGYEILGGRTPGTTSGIISIRREGLDSRYLIKKMKDAGMLAAPRQGWARIAPHFYIEPEEIDRVLDLLPGA